MAFGDIFIGDKWDLIPATAQYDSSLALLYPDWAPCDASGVAFDSDPDPAVVSWGLPTGIAALDEDVALVAFGTDDQAGTLAATLDGGATWAKAPAPSLPASCGGEDVFGGSPELALVPQDSYYATPTEWEIHAIFRVSPKDRACGLAEVASRPRRPGACPRRGRGSIRPSPRAAPTSTRRAA